MRRQYDVFQSDVFSLGMTMLQVASLRPSSTLYDWKNHEVKWDKVEDALTGLLANYSGDFVGYLRTMLSKEPTNRPTFQDIHSWTEQPFQQEATYIPPPWSSQPSSKNRNSSRVTPCLSRCLCRAM